MYPVKRIKKSFRFDARAYKEMASVYSVKDGIFALAICILVVFFNMWSALFSWSTIFLIVLAIIPFVVLLYTNDKVETLGLTKKNFIKSCVCGICWGVLLFLILPTDRIWPWNLPHQTIMRAIYNIGEQFENASSVLGIISIVLFIFFNAMLIAFAEEVFFRGYLQIRIYGIIKSDIFAIVTGGFIFALLHIPSRLSFIHVQYNLPFASSILFYFKHYFLLPSYLFFIAFHFLCVYLHRKYNSLVAPIVVHFFVSLRMFLGI